MVQLDFLKQLCRAFEVESGSSCADVSGLHSMFTCLASDMSSDGVLQDDVGFARFVAEAISTLDFKRCEEPMFVISRLNTILAMSGLQVLHSLEAELSHGGGLLGLDDEMQEDENENEQVEGAKTSKRKSRPVHNLLVFWEPLGVDACLSSQRSASASLDLVRQSIISGLALLLRDHLKQLYSIK